MIMLPFDWRGCCPCPTCRAPGPEKIHPRREFRRALRDRVTVPNPAKAADGKRTARPAASADRTTLHQHPLPRL